MSINYMYVMYVTTYTPVSPSYREYISPNIRVLRAVGKQFSGFNNVKYVELGSDHHRRKLRASAQYFASQARSKITTYKLQSTVVTLIFMLLACDIGTLGRV